MNKTQIDSGDSDWSILLKISQKATSLGSAASSALLTIFLYELKGKEISSRDLSENLGISYSCTRRAVTALIRGGILESLKDGRRRRLIVNRAWWTWNPQVVKTEIRKSKGSSPPKFDRSVVLRADPPGRSATDPLVRSDMRSPSAISD